MQTQSLYYEFKDWFENNKESLKEEYAEEGQESMTAEDIYSSDEGFREAVDEAWRNACAGWEARNECRYE